MKIPNPIDPVVEAIDKAHQDKAEPPRFHMGCSLLGHHCERYLWLNFRWAVIEPFPGRILRLFRRGHHEEFWIVDDLKSIGVDITNTGDDQSRVDFGCHVSGSIDGIIQSGLPQAPKTKHVAEFKTHALKSFLDVVKDGVEKSKPMHYAQMQMYMLGTGLKRALYLAVCKNDDQIYTERVKLDKDVAQSFVDKGKRLALAERMPEPCAGGGVSWYQCKFCPAHEFCWETQTTKEINCRTCANVTPKEDGTFFCEKNKSTIPNENQFAEYDCHVIHPDLVPWKLIDSGQEYVGAYEINGNQLRNGEGFTPSKVLLNDVVNSVLGEFECSYVHTNKEA